MLQHLEGVIILVNANKSSWEHDKVDYLGLTIDWEGIRLQSKKVEAILTLREPKICKKLCQYISMVNFYCNRWERQSHLLVPLNRVTSKNKLFIWKTAPCMAFNNIKKFIRS